MMLDIFCIGTPKIVGDAVGPLVGTMLKLHKFENDVNIVGTLDDPVTFTTYKKKLSLLRPGAKVIVVDATVGERVGTYEIVEGSTSPGSALSTGIDPVGDISIKAYTGPTLQSMIEADNYDVTIISYKIVQELIELINTTNKGIYIEI